MHLKKVAFTCVLHSRVARPWNISCLSKTQQLRAKNVPLWTRLRISLNYSTKLVKLSSRFQDGAWKGCFKSLLFSGQRLFCSSCCTSSTASAWASTITWRSGLMRGCPFRPRGRPRISSSKEELASMQRATPTTKHCKAATMRSSMVSEHCCQVCGHCSTPSLGHCEPIDPIEYRC